MTLDQKDFFVVEEGNLVIINGNVLHEGSCSDDLLSLVIIFNMDDLTKELADKNIVFQEMIRKDSYIQRMLNKFYEEYIRKELADLIHLSEDRFNHLFKECMSVSPLQYMNEVRLEKAMRLIKEGMPATEAAGMVGFLDYNYFGRLFRRKFGYSPGKVLDKK